MTSDRQFVAIQTETILPCMTCPICHKLFRNATTISECLHSFCKKCIYNKITREELDCCPVCNVYLGCAPLERLRPDHYLQDIRAILFNPSTRKESKEPKSGPSIPLPAATKEPEETDDVHSVPLPGRRKKRSMSISSLVRQPKASSETGMIGRKKPGPKKAYAPRGSTLSINEPTGKEEESRKSSSPHLTLSKITRYKEQNLHDGESSKQKMPKKGAVDPVVTPLDGMADIWKPLNCLVEAADATRLGNPPMPLSVTKSVPPSIRSDEAPVNKTKSKERSVRFNVVEEGGSHLVPSGSGKSVPTSIRSDEALTNKTKSKERSVQFNDVEEGGSHLVPSSPSKPRKYFGVHWKRDGSCEGGNIAPQALVNAASTVSNEGAHPIWFSLVASDSQEGDAPLPQIPSCYLRIKNANLPVSFIQKYIVKKLNLYSEAEVEITMQGHLVPPDLQLRNLIDLWSRRAPKSETLKTAVGRSAEDFVMVLCYGRKT
ncbi:E3 ubiquitin protein ligase DRIP2-like [Rhododendron vialii]|uniref:E3 ubiquitin protein ligase DRIP2-like n=1 Tax=Rhododendron vialii TaxID=182163 RepID=UPI00265DAC93|nr:E3 ubiquitin protein ligase DRIP2-like [Rhododendron vialii]